MRAYAIALDVLSPLFNPFILFFVISPKAGEIVQFFVEKNRNVPGLGDVCSYALMDLKDGEKELAELQGDETSETHINRVFTRPQKNKCRGKIELSLLNFATMNPDWRPPADAANFIAHVHEKTKNSNMGQHLMLHSFKDIERPIANSLNTKSMLASQVAPLNPDMPGPSGTTDKFMTASHYSDGTNDDQMRAMSPLYDSLAMSVIQQHIGADYAQPMRVQRKFSPFLIIQIYKLHIFRKQSTSFGNVHECTLTQSNAYVIS